MQWAYGVTCWEIFTGGRIPYAGVHPLELGHQIESGYRLEKPLNAACTDEMYVSLNAYMVSSFLGHRKLRAVFSKGVVFGASAISYQALFLAHAIIEKTKKVPG